MRPRHPATHVHLWIGLWTWLCAIAVIGLVAAGAPLGRAAQAVASILCMLATLFGIGLAGWAWIQQRPPYDRDDLQDPLTIALGVALFAGTGVGAHAGLLRDASFSGSDHVAFATAYLGLLPSALLVSVIRTPLWRAALEITVLMIGVEVAAQLGYAWSAKRGRWWWDDIAGMDLAYLLGGFVAALLWWTWGKLRPGAARRPRVWASPEDADAPVPRKAKSSDRV